MNDQQRIETAADNCEVLRARLARYEDADGNPKAHPSGVVLPSDNAVMRIVLREMGSSTHVRGTSNWCADVGMAVVREVARLNSSTVSAGDYAQYPPCDYCAEQLNYHPWHGSGLINGVESRHIHACDKCRHLLPTVSAGDDRETIRAVFLRNGFTIKEGQADLKPYVYAAADELMSIARAALSAPSHGGQVLEGWQLVPFDLKDIHDALAAAHSAIVYQGKSTSYEYALGKVSKALHAVSLALPVTENKYHE